MGKNRRKFILTAGLAAGVAAAGGLELLASDAALGTAERDVRRVVSKYGIGRTSSCDAQSVEMTVKMRSHRAFAQVFNGARGLPFEHISVTEGNTLSFTHRSVAFTLKNVV